MFESFVLRKNEERYGFVTKNTFEKLHTAIRYKKDLISLHIFYVVKKESL